jgi:DNA modification methylase
MLCPKTIKRIIDASSLTAHESFKGDIVLDLFSHSGTTLLTSEIFGRRCFTSDLNPVFCEISLRRLENYRTNNKTGWQNSNPFLKEIQEDKKLKSYLEEKYKIELKSKEYSL